MKKDKKVLTDEEILKTLRDTKGDEVLSSQLLGVGVEELREEIESRKGLRILTNVSPDDDEMSDADTLIRGANELLDTTVVRTPDPIFDAGKKNMNDVLSDMKAAGIGDEVLNKIRVLSGSKVNPAAFLVTTMDITQRLMHYHVLKLVEMMDALEGKMRDPNLPLKLQTRYMELWAECSDLLGRHSDRVVNATTALYRIASPAKDQRAKEVKPGFSTYDAK